MAALAPGVRASASAGPSEVVVFHVDEMKCGMDIRDIQEIKRIQGYTPVFRAPSFVRGLVNMRGQIVTLVDVRERLGLSPRPIGRGDAAIVVASSGGLVGLLVDAVDDVIEAERAEMRPPPSNLAAVEGHYFTAVIHSEAGLVALLDKDRIAGANAHRRGGGEAA